MKSLDVVIFGRKILEPLGIEPGTLGIVSMLSLSHWDSFIISNLKESSSLTQQLNYQLHVLFDGFHHFLHHQHISRIEKVDDKVI